MTPIGKISIGARRGICVVGKFYGIRMSQIVVLIPEQFEALMEKVLQRILSAIEAKGCGKRHLSGKNVEAGVPPPTYPK